MARKAGESKVCTICRKRPLIVDMHVVDGRHYCHTCYATLHKCAHCNTVIGYNNWVIQGGRHYCRGCFSTLFDTCRACNNIFPVNEMRTGVNGRHYCNHCYDERFAPCNTCGEVQYVDGLHNGTCSHCRGNNPIRDYSYQPALSFGKEVYENTLYLGVELEVEPTKRGNTDSASDFRSELLKLGVQNKYYLKYDGSINGYEIVTQPFTLKYGHNNMRWHEVLKYLRSEKYESYESGSCGLHVHVSRKSLTSLDIAKLRMFFAVCQLQIGKFSMRKGNYHYCRFEDSDSLSKMLRGQQDGRYWACNINTCKDTVEFRVFRGTLNEKRFTATLQFCDAVVAFVKSVGMTHIYGVKEANAVKVWETFIGFIKKENRYCHLHRYLNQHHNGEEVCA